MKNNFFTKTLLLFFFVTELHAVEIEQLRCEYQINPLGVDVASPHLSWLIVCPKRGEYQSAYRVLVASSEALLAKGKGDLWDSGKIASGQSIHVAYQGKPLQAGVTCFWKVQVWDMNGKPPAWSRPARWTMGLPTASDWAEAQWIASKDGQLWRDEWAAHKENELRGVSAKVYPDTSWPWHTGKDSSIFALYEMAEPKYDPAPLFRKEFTAAKKIRTASLFICGLGYYEAFINGERVGDHVLDPAWTNFEQRAMYATYDVTGLLRQGGNAIGVMLGRGQYNPLCNDIWGLSKSAWIDQPKLIALLRIEYTDNAVVSVVTDGTWKTAGGPVVYDDTRHGELYDARLEPDGWASPAYDDTGWKQASVTQWQAQLTSQMMPPVRCFEAIAPVKTYTRDNGMTIYDIGQNIAGWARVTVRGPAGKRVLVEYCETPSDNELVAGLTPWRFMYNIPNPHYASFYDKAVNVRQQNGYITSGKGAETFECHFSYKGFQFVRVTADEGVAVERVEGIPVHTDVEKNGDFTCSNPVINQLQKNAVNSLLGNYHSIATDCPHREKQGWTADNYMSSQAAMYNFNMAAFYTKWSVDLAGTQGPSGGLCTVAPSTGYDQNQSTAWPAAIVHIPWDVYRFYADTRPMADNYVVMRRFAESSLLRQVAGKPEIIREVLGDWIAPVVAQKPPVGNAVSGDWFAPVLDLNDTLRNSTMAPPEGCNLYGTAAHYLTVKRLSDISRVLGRDSEADELGQWATRIATCFNNEFFNAERGVYHGENPTGYRQAANIVPLEYGIVAPKYKQTVFDRLLKDIHVQGDRLSTGFLGTPALMEYLATEEPELAFKIATQPRYPGWGYMIAQGANAMWESWDGYDSRNHTPFCLISGYFYKYLAGIQPDTATPGFKHIVINPSIVGDLQYVEAYHDSPYGRIKSSWKREKEQLILEVTIPANTTATVYVPALSASGITESGQPADKAVGVEFKGMENGKAKFNTGSGSYRFTSSINI